jgi:hypothetical protein
MSIPYLDIQLSSSKEEATRPGHARTAILVSRESGRHVV